MKGLDLLQQLQLDLSRERMICLTGSGGKTSLLYYLGRRCAIAKIPAALLTTTHIRPPREPLFPLVWDGNAAKQAWQHGCVPVLGTPSVEGKLGPPSPELLGRLYEEGWLLLVEADGSRRLPIKFPNATEPVLPPQTSRVITVAGLSALGRPLAEVCHRWELACRILGLSPNQKVTPELLSTLLCKGYGKYHPTVLLNQSDIAKPEDCQYLQTLLHQRGVRIVAATSLKQEVLPC